MLIQEELISLQRSFLTVIEEAKQLATIFPAEVNYPPLIGMLNEYSRALNVDLNILSQVVSVCNCLEEILQIRNHCMKLGALKRVGQKLDEFITQHVPLIFKLANLSDSLKLKKILKEWYEEIFNGLLSEEQKYNDEIRVMSRLLLVPESLLQQIEDIVDAGALNSIVSKLEELKRLQRESPLSEEAQIKITSFSYDVQNFISRICALVLTNVFYEGGITFSSIEEERRPVSDEEFLLIVAHWSKQQADMVALQREIARLSTVCSGLVMRKNSVMRVFCTINGLLQKFKWPILDKSIDELIKRINTIKLTAMLISTAVQEWRATQHAGMPLDMTASSVGAVLPSGASALPAWSSNITPYAAIKRCT